MSDNRINILEAAKSETLAGNYNKAIKCINKLLSKNSNDIDALILNGNVFELRVFARELENIDDDAVNDMMIARECYNKVLALNSNNIRALHDLAQNYKNTDEIDKSILKYKELINIITSMPSRDADIQEELEDAIAELAELVKS